ncbi:putative SWEET sugar transporter [Helianthus annuus]|nr:putative SWEET sugar transporter [Helianthus annuus]KAJ0750306.1 putative SWEET sugar transporter [Helianthus annuus]
MQPDSSSSWHQRRINNQQLLIQLITNKTNKWFFVCRITFQRIINNSSTEQFSGVPYPMTLLNCLLSGWYGLPFVSENNALVTVINGVGALIEGLYVMVFVMYAPKKEKRFVGWLVVFVLVTFATVALVSVLVLAGDMRRCFCGFAAAVFSVIMYASPLSIVMTVIRTKSVEFMPFFLSLMVFLCGTSWFIFGLLGNDPFLYVCNGFGSLLGALQLILYAIYKDNAGNKDEKQVAEEGGSAKGTGVVDENKQAEEGNLTAAENDKV